MRRGEAKETRSGGNRKHKNGLSDGAKPGVKRRTAAEVTYSILSLDGITRIVVTHALEETLLRRFDGILVMKDGKVGEFGTFDDLMKEKGYFYALFTVTGTERG